MLRFSLPVMLLAACTTLDEPPPSAALIDQLWSREIRSGDLIVAVPGTGAYTGTGKWIDAAVDPAYPNTPPIVDAVANPQLNPIVLEQAIAAAQRAGFGDADLASGTVTLALWGAGVTKASSFEYRSLGGVRVPFVVLGGKHSCATGTAPDNFGNYQRSMADADARDLYRRTQTFLASNSPRNVVVVSHSWGGAIAEHLVLHLAQLRGDLGPFADNAPISFVVAAGVPPLIVGESFPGAGLRDFDPPTGKLYLYEVDRPDDMMHNLNPSGNIEGHQYDIMFGHDFRGSYGITTMELSCSGVPGPCSAP